MAMVRSKSSKPLSLHQHLYLYLHLHLYSLLRLHLLLYLQLQLVTMSVCLSVSQSLLFAIPFSAFVPLPRSRHASVAPRPRLAGTYAHFHLQLLFPSLCACIRMTQSVLLLSLPHTEQNPQISYFHFCTVLILAGKTLSVFDVLKAKTTKSQFFRKKVVNL